MRHRTYRYAVARNDSAVRDLQIRELELICNLRAADLRRGYAGQRGNKYRS